MKKAVKIVGIVYIPLLILSFFGLLIYGIMCLASATDAGLLNQVVVELQKTYGDMITAEYVQGILVMVSRIFFIGSVAIIAGLVFDIILVVRSSKEDGKYSNSSWIVFGVLEIIFGAWVEGVLAIIYGATYKDKPTPEPTIQEVHYEEEKTDDKPNPSDYDAPDHLD